MPEGQVSRLRAEDVGFFVLMLGVSLALAWLVAPFFGAILWGLVAAILFSPANRFLVRRLRGRRNLAAALTLSLIVAVVIVPAFLVGASLVQEAGGLYSKLQSGHVDIAGGFDTVRHALPAWARDMLDSGGLSDFEAVRAIFASTIATGLRSIASRALLFGQGALGFLASVGVMLYLVFFLLRDGEVLSREIKRAIPLHPQMREALIAHFIVVVRATMKGTVVVAILQGIVGGLIFWLLGVEGALLWGLLMGLFSLLPAVGTGIVWVPVALYLLLTGSVWEGVVLTGCGLFVIGLIDNLLRPILIGHDTRMPDFVVLIATLAGLELFGLNGFIMGPMIAALFVAVWKLFAETRGTEI